MLVSCWCIIIERRHRAPNKNATPRMYIIYIICKARQQIWICNVFLLIILLDNNYLCFVHVNFTVINYKLHYTCCVHLSNSCIFKPGAKLQSVEVKQTFWLHNQEHIYVHSLSENPDHEVFQFVVIYRENSRIGELLFRKC